MYVKEYVSMKELAPEFGMTQKGMGIALEDIDLWEVGGEPTKKAYDGGYVSERIYPGYEEYPGIVWHREKTIAALEAAGYQRRNDT